MPKPSPSRVVASEAVRSEWLRRVQAEYTSAAITQGFTLWLMQIGASPDLVRSGLRIVWDEMIHARMSHRTYVAAGGERAPELVRDRLALRYDETEPLEHEVTRVAVKSFCIGETVAVPLFMRLRQGCVVPVARRALDRVLRDEVRHRDFGWAVLGSLLDGAMGVALRGVAAEALPRGFRDVRTSYGGASKRVAPMSEADRGWGLMPAAEYSAIVEKTLERDWIRRFGALGIDARAAWDRSE